MNQQPPEHSWELVIPVKPTSHGKSRLNHPLYERVALAKSLALDTIEAAATCNLVSTVLVVTKDRELTSELSGSPKIHIIPDTADGLNEAIELGLTFAGANNPCGVLLGDLPALRPQELAHALALAASHKRAFIADAEGTGTVLLTAQSKNGLIPQFGLNSASAHRDSGFAELDLPTNSGLRRDVDTVDQLQTLSTERLGRRTAALISSP